MLFLKSSSRHRLDVGENSYWDTALNTFSLSLLAWQHLLIIIILGQKQSQKGDFKALELRKDWYSIHILCVVKLSTKLWSVQLTSSFSFQSVDISVLWHQINRKLWANSCTWFDRRSGHRYKPHGWGLQKSRWLEKQHRSFPWEQHWHAGECSC